MSWQEVVVKDVCESIVDCVNKTAPVVDYETPYKMIRTTNVRHGVIDTENTRFVTEETFEKWTRRLLPQAGDVILTREAPLGEVGMLKNSEEKIFLGQRLMQFRVDEKKLDNYFLLYSLQGSHMQGQLQAASSGSTVAHVRVGDVENLKIKLPSIDEQKRIAGILKAYEDLIENNNRRIQILETIAQKLYQEWFVHYRFPNHQQAQWQETEQGKVPMGWEIKELGELITVRRGRTITRKKAVPEDVPVVAGGLQPAYFHNVANTTAPVITVSASGANAGYVNLYTIPVWASDCSYIDTETTPYVYYYYLLMKERQVEITRMQTGAAQPHVYPKDLMRLEVLDIPLELLDEFTQKITPMFQLMAGLKAKNQNLKQQRDLLLPRLIGG